MQNVSFRDILHEWSIPSFLAINNTCPCTLLSAEFIQSGKSVDSFLESICPEDDIKIIQGLTFFEDNYRDIF